MKIKVQIENAINDYNTARSLRNFLADNLGAIDVRDELNLEQREKLQLTISTHPVDYNSINSAIAVL